MYGPKMPIKFAPMDATANPVCRKHVGYVSMACKLMAKNVMASQNFMVITDAVLTNSQSGSKVVPVGIKKGGGRV